MNINLAFPSKWIRATDLQGRDITMTILRVLEEVVDRDGGDTKPVVYFGGTKKGLVLNKVNADTITEMAGEETDDWTGQIITLYPTKTDFGGTRVDCIRIRDLPPNAAPEPPEPAPAVAAAETPAVTEDDPIPF